MAIRGISESTLSQSEIYQGLNSSLDTAIPESAKNLIKTAKHITNEDIEAAYISVKQISDTLTRAALKAYDSGKTILLYNNVPDISMTQALPFITFKTSTGYSTYVFMDKYIKISKDGVMNVSAPVLRDLLTGALISTGIKKDYSNLAMNQYLASTLMQIYCKFATRTLNRLYAIISDKVANDTIQYWINKFFLTKIFNASDTPENIETLSTKHFKYIDELKEEEIKKQYEEANPNKFSELLNLVKTASPRMANLSLASFLSDWMNYYYVPATFAIDNIEYLIFMVIALLGGNNIVSIAASDIVKDQKNIKALRGELLKLI